MTAYEEELTARGFVPINPSSLFMVGAQATFRDAAIPIIKPYPSSTQLYAPKWAVEIYGNLVNQMKRTRVMQICNTNERTRGIALTLLHSSGRFTMSDYLESLVP